MGVAVGEESISGPVRLDGIHADVCYAKRFVYAHSVKQRSHLAKSTVMKTGDVRETHGIVKSGPRGHARIYQSYAKFFEIAIFVASAHLS